MYIFIALDHLSKFVVSLFHKFGVPQIFHSDNGKQFTSSEFSNFLSKYGCSHTRNALYSPQANASDRVNRSIIAAIRAYVSEDQKDWDQHLSAVECLLRSIIHSSIGFSPYFTLFGIHIITHGSAY